MQSPSDGPRVSSYKAPMAPMLVPVMDIQEDGQKDGQKKPTTIDATQDTATERQADPKPTTPASVKQHTPSEANTSVKDVADDAANDGELSSLPDTSSVSSVNPDMLGDEIVVGTRANGGKSPARRIASEKNSGAMDGADEEEEPAPHYRKRKRTSYTDYYDRTGSTPVKDTDGADVSVLGVKKQNDDAKHVPIGYWRDSPVPNESGKHVVVGFIDSRDRLRTRIRATDLKNGFINLRLFPVPPGPGGSWVTFERIVFLDHLIGSDHNVIKEYVKIRAETNQDSSKEADLAALREARRRLEANPPPETPQPPPIAWGREIPENAQGSRSEAKRRRYGSGVGTIAERSERHETHEQPDQTERIEQVDRVEHTPLALQLLPEISQPPRKPTRILVGVWAKSSPPNLEDKHAVYGILGANDMFRVKLMRETKDGRYIDGNFPSGAGALWIAYDEVIFLDHLSNLTRPEIKEYVRIRQAQIDAGEMKEEQVANETKAVHEAQIRAANIAAAGPNGTSTPAVPVISREDARETHELRQSRRDVTSQPSRQSRYAQPEVNIQQASRNSSNGPVERVQGYANREVARIEAIQSRNSNNQHATTDAQKIRAQQEHAAWLANENAKGPYPGAPQPDIRREFANNMGALNNVWRVQEHMRMEPTHPNGDVMMHEGIKYERKQNGPFKDKLVSQGTIINIDGEDYVEYRVLTKPSFF
ncbi:hypothetical protein M426DRAFT_17177 [Hypoxylon sp. CI-4A]|nr:hypothetical protein M426DRAFT_17177 [Hypoxylon sp. CI-4A]